MWAKRIEDLAAFQLGNEFKLEVYRLIDGSPTAQRDFKFRDQIRHAAAGIERNLNEGFPRRLETEFATFIRYGLASLAEAKGHVRDGIDRRYFSETDCRDALALARRCEDVCSALYRRIQQSIDAKRRQQIRRPGSSS